MSLQSRWNGSLRFAELVFPVGLAATRNGREDVTLSTLHRACASPLVQVRECPVHGPVGEDELVKGWEAAPGEYVLVEQAELEEAFQLPEAHLMEVLQVVEQTELDPALVRNSWYLVPGPGELPARCYQILRKALLEESAALVVRFPAFGVDQVAAVVPAGEILLVQKLAAHDELHPADAIADRLEVATATDEELELARTLVGRSISAKGLDRGVLVNRKRAAIRGLVEGKRVAGKTVRAEQVPSGSTHPLPASAPVDLLAALKASVKKTPAKRRPRARTKAAAAV